MADLINKDSPGLLRGSARFLSGRLVWGQKTDGGYFRPGSRVQAGRPSAWVMLPGWKRQAVRLGVPTAALASYDAYLHAPVYTEAGMAALATMAGVRGVRAGRRAWKLRRFRRTYIRPTLAALGPALGDAPVHLHVDPELGSLVTRLAKPMSPAEKWLRERYGAHVEPVLRWLPDRAMRAWWAAQKGARPVTRHLDLFRRPVDGDRGPRIELTATVPYLTDEQQRFVSSVIHAKIPAGELVERWDQVGQRVTFICTVRKRPPADVGYADLAARIGQLKEWEFFLGLGVGSKSVTISLRDDSPHIAESAGTGAGKSVLAQLIGVQVLARGGRVVILDVKGSHRWAMGLPGVEYCTTPEQMHKALVRLGALADARNQQAFQEAEGWDPGERVLVIAEELNATFTRLRDYWTEVRGGSDAKVSPAVKAFRNLLFMGRSAKVNMLAIAQMLTANTTGGPESRENFGVRALARYTKNNWQMLCPEAPMPRPSRTLGRWQIVVGGVATECQVCFLTPAEARLLVHKLSPRPRTPLMDDDLEMSPGHGSGGDKSAPADPLSERVTLREAAERGIVPWAHAAAKKRMQRGREKGDATVPKAVGQRGQADLYTVGDLVVWAESELVK